MALLHSFSWLSSIPLRICTTSSLGCCSQFLSQLSFRSLVQSICWLMNPQSSGSVCLLFLPPQHQTYSLAHIMPSVNIKWVSRWEIILPFLYLCQLTALAKHIVFQNPLWSISSFLHSLCVHHLWVIVMQTDRLAHFNWKPVSLRVQFTFLQSLFSAFWSQQSGCLR